jgi:hypothetical protein
MSSSASQDTSTKLVDITQWLAYDTNPIRAI